MLWWMQVFDASMGYEIEQDFGKTIEMQQLYLNRIEPFKNWAICYRYFVYTLKEEDDMDYLYIIDLENKNATIKVENFGTDDSVKYISYNNNLLFCASSDEIQVVEIFAHQFVAEESKTIDASTLIIRKIVPNLTIHGFLLNVHCLNDKYQLIAMETPDHQLDFNKLFIYDIQDQDKYNYKFEQYREIIPRKNFEQDRIVKNKFVFSKGFNYTLSMRESGRFDLYWNMSRKESPQNLYVQDIAMSTTSFYFKMKDGNYYGFEHKNKSGITFQLAQPIQKDELDFYQVHVKIVQNIVSLYAGFHLVKIGIAMCIIAHGKFISLFDLIEWKWLNHIEFEDDIIKLFRIYKTKDSRYQSVLLKNGAVYLGVMDYDEYVQPVPIEKRTLRIEGEILRATEDIENNQTLYIVVKEAGNIKLKCIQRTSVHEIPVVKPQENLSVVLFQYRGDDSLVLIQNGNKLMLYKQISDNNGPQLKIIHTFDTDKITGILHSGTAYDINKHMFLFDEKNFYVVKANPDSVTVYPNVYCIGFQNFTKSFNYAICQETSDSKNPGLRLFDMESIINKNKCNMTLLKKIDIGTQGYFEFGANVVRFGFIKSLTHLIVTPILHRNMNKFMGIKATNDYICYKVIKDKFIALTLKGELQSWNILTGKPLTTEKLPEHDYTAYELASKYKKDAVLLKSRNKIENMRSEDFFFPWQLQTNTQNQDSFVKTVNFTIKNWRYIEIKNEKEITVHLEYVHPSYPKEWIFVNDKKDRLIVILTNYRTYLYKAIRHETPGAATYKVQWELIRQITDYPAELENDAGRLEFFSPDFSKYIIVNKKNNEFLIKDSSTDQILHRIPKDLMNIQKDTDPSTVINRFRWRDQNQFQIVSEEGIEKIINIQEGFRETQFNYRPLFNEIDGVEYLKSHYYLLRSDLTTNQVLQRLKRKYQTYKTSYFLNNKRLNSDLYQDLLTVDPIKFDFNEHSFTFLHWSLIEQLQQGQLKIEELEEPVVEQILYNILPGGNTVLHKLCDQEDELIKIFKIAHPNGEQIKYHVPFLPNLTGDTPIHKCISKSDYKSIDTILKYLKVYPIDHHSRGIKSLYPLFVEQCLPEFLGYIESRLQQTQQLKKMNKGCLKPDTSGMIISELWFDEKEFHDQIMTKKPVETRILCEIIDMPSIYHYLDKDFQSFFEKLATTNESEFFRSKAIQKLIDFNYPLAREYLIKKLFAPFTVFNLIFFVFMNFIYEYKHLKYYEDMVLPSMVVIVAFATYFLMNEIRQMSIDKLAYFSTFWNYIDIIPPIGIYILSLLIILNNFDIHISPAIERTIQAVVTFFMWFKFLYFLRIFKNTGYLISMIFEVIKDMRYFLFVLLITILAFGDSLLSLSLGNKQEDQFVHDFLDSAIYTYRMILGDFDTSKFGNVASPVVMMLFLLCTVFNMIVMLNLLIAIISDSYARVTSKSAQAVYQEMASMIVENSYLIPYERKLTYAQKDKYLLIVNDLDKIEHQRNEDPILQRQEKLEKFFETKIGEMKKSQEIYQTKIETKIESMATQITENKKDIDKKIGELKVLMLQSAPEVKIQTKIHAHLLTKMTLFILKQKHKDNGYNTGYICDGHKFTGCKSGGLEQNRKVLAEELYHCSECNFDYCKKCFLAYGDTHKHNLSKMTYEQLIEINADYKQGWACDARSYSGCHQNGKTIDDEFATVFHHDECKFDLCEKCSQTYLE